MESNVTDLNPEPISIPHIEQNNAKHFYIPILLKPPSLRPPKLNKFKLDDPSGIANATYPPRNKAGC